MPNISQFRGKVNNKIRVDTVATVCYSRTMEPTDNQEMPMPADDSKEMASRSHDMFLKQLGAQMVVLDINQSELARRLDISRAYVSEVLKGGRRLSLNSMFRWAAAVGLDVEIKVTERAN